MGGMKVSDLDFLRLLPAFMRDDEAAIALSKAMNKLISEPGQPDPLDPDVGRNQQHERGRARRAGVGA